MNSCIENQEIKLSVIIPVYNTEPFFERCIESVLRQSYRNLEILIVNDGSKGNIAEIADAYLKKDHRIRYIDQGKNTGLFKARVAGVSESTGDYIAFVDSDDYISVDFYHRLLSNSVQYNSDIAIGKTVWQEADGSQYIYNYHHANFMFSVLRGEQVQQKYFGQRGSCYSWHTIWNKIYRKELWNKILPYLKSIDEHIIMTEDILFSSLLFFHAGSVSAVENDAYFYCENEGASTNARKMTMERYRKNMHDINCVFQAVENYLTANGASQEIISCFSDVRKLYARMWRRLPESDFHGEDLKEARKLCEQFCDEKQEWENQQDSFFESLKTKWKGGLEYFKDQIMSEKYPFISFDIFDTLLKRPFFEPEQMFLLLDKKFEELCGANIRFRDIRIEGERIARAEIYKKNPNVQDITLTEIYNFIETTYGISRDIARNMYLEEIALEYRFCEKRKAGNELYELARLMHKKIVLISDMYLEKDVVKELLMRNQVEVYAGLYVSSDAKVLKYNGDLFKFALKKEGISPQQVLHIGDTWASDMEGAKKAGVDTLFLPKSTDIFRNLIQDQNTNLCGEYEKLSYSVIEDISSSRELLGFSCMKKLAADRYFDNPYRSFHAGSDLNGDPYFFGYYIVGMYILGLVQWVIKLCCENNYKTILFTSRDGWLPMMAYQHIQERYPGLPGYDYLYVSRKAVMCGMVKCRQDFYDLPIEYRNHCPKSMFSMLEFCSKYFSEQDIDAWGKKHQIQMEMCFRNKEEYIGFISRFLEDGFSEQKMQEEQEKAAKYYKKIDDNTLLFDMGYSGRIQNAVSHLCGRPIDVCFVYADKQAGNMSRKGNFKIFSLYDFIPSVSGLLREHIFSEPAGGCIGFKTVGNEIKPICEDTKKSIASVLMINNIHAGVLDFIKDYLNTFQGFEHWMDFRVHDTSALFEAYLRYAKEIDIKMFSSAEFDDFVYGGQKQINVFDFVREQNLRLSMEQEKEGNSAVQNTMDNQEILMYLANQKSKFVRTLLFLLMDRKIFIKKFKKNWGKIWSRK